MKKILHYLDEYLEEFLMVIFLIAMTLIMGIQVFSRYILGMSLSWSEEITRYLFIWSAFLSVSLCTRKCISIKIDQFIQLFPRRGKSIWKVLNLTVEFVFFVYLIPYSFIYLKNTIESGQVSPACGIPMYYVQAAPFVCFIITAFRIAQSGRKGPVLVDIPKDVTAAVCEFTPRKPLSKTLSARKSLWRILKQFIVKLKRERRNRCQQLLFLLFLQYVL